jgi:ATP-binding cassette subfamily F protein 3
MDIMSREVLENALETFDGTIVAVSHDRYFIKKLATRILSFEKSGGVFDYKGTYEEYLQYSSENRQSSVQNFPVNETISDSKQQYLKAKQENAEKRKYENKIKRYKKEIAEMEQRLTQIPSEIEKYATNSEKLTELYSESDKLESHMMELMEELDSLGETF